MPISGQKMFLRSGSVSGSAERTAFRNFVCRWFPSQRQSAKNMSRANGFSTCRAFSCAIRIRVCSMGQKSTSLGCIVMSAAIPKAEISNLEDYNMHRASGYIASLLLAAAIAAPVSIIASPGPQGANGQVRVYDKDRKDYHN